MSSTTTDKNTPDFLPALTRYTRTEKVAAQLAEMSRLPRAAILRRAAVTDKTLRLERETLVALVRAYLRVGDEAAADAVLDRLVRRVRGAIRAKVAEWSTLASMNREDAEGDAVLKLMEYVRNLMPAEELWECNFATPFHLRLNSLLKALTGRQVAAAAPREDYQNEAGQIELRFTEIEVQQAIKAYSGGDPRIAEFLYLRMEGFPDVEIAERMKLTTRTLRNWAVKVQALWTQEVCG